MQEVPEVIGSINPRKSRVGSKIVVDLIFESFNPKVVRITIWRISNDEDEIKHRENYTVSSNNKISFPLDTTGWTAGEYGLEVRGTTSSGSGRQPPAMYATRFYLF